MQYRGFAPILGAVNTSDLEDLAPVIGYRATRILQTWYCGTYLHVPARSNEAHPLVELLGQSAFNALVREYPGERFTIPTHDDDDRYRRDRRIANLLAAGKTPSDVAAELTLTVRRVEQIRESLVESGWLRYAQGYDTAKAEGRRRRPLSQLPEVILNLGTGDTPGASPTP